MKETPKDGKQLLLTSEDVNLTNSFAADDAAFDEVFRADTCDRA
jgi:hypothetical protein